MLKVVELRPKSERRAWIAIRRRLVLIAFALSPFSAHAWRSALYPLGWTPDYTDSQGRFVHDFSYAGYHNSEVSLPTAGGLTLNVVTQYGADPTGSTDSNAAIQTAIDDAKTSGGAIVFFPAGIYRCDGQLTIQGDHTVLRGLGPATSRLQFTLATSAVAYDGHIRFQGDVQWGTDVLLDLEGQNRSFHVNTYGASGLSLGQEVAVGWIITPEFVAEHGMTGTWTQFNGQWRPFFRRRIVDIDLSTSPETVRLDVPLRHLASRRDSASIRPVIHSPTVHGYLIECGMEDLGISNAVDPTVALTLNQVQAVQFRHTQDCWVRNVQSFASTIPAAAGAHLQSGGVLIENSNRVTVADSVMQKAQNHGSGGNGYLFQVSRSNEVLFRDCVGATGRHNFIQNWDFGTTGCVWLRCDTSGATDEYGFLTKSEYHHSLAMACLVDSCAITDGWQGGNRKLQSSGAGHTVTQSVYWNNNGTGTIGSWNYGWGYVIGTGSTLNVTTAYTFLGYYDGTTPEDFKEGLGLAATLEPQSLFEDQLALRLVNRVRGKFWDHYE